MMLYERGEQELCAVSPLPRPACTRAHELATYLTSRATYYVGYRPVQYRLTRDLHMRHVQTQDGGGTKKKIPAL